MPWQNGVFERKNPEYGGADIWQLDQRNGKKIEADRHDHHDQDLANGINNCLTKDGSNQMTANMDLGGFALVNVGKATINDEVMLLGQAINDIEGDGTKLVLKRPYEDDIDFDITTLALAAVATKYGSQQFLPTNFNGVKTTDFVINHSEGWLCVASSELSITLPPTLTFNHSFIIENSKASTHPINLLNTLYSIVGTHQTLSAGTNLILAPGDIVYLVAVGPTTMEIV